jgi:hypothetical protein
MDAILRRDALAASATAALMVGNAGALAQGTLPAVRDATDPNALRALIVAARSNTPDLPELMTRYLPGLQAGGAAAVPAGATVPMGGTTTVGTPASGNVVAVFGQDFLFALASEEPATIAIDGRVPVPMMRVAGTAYWYRLETLRIGTTHTFTLFSGGRDVGTNSVAGYTPDSYPIPGAARGTLSDKRSITSRIYGGATADYWIYTNAGTDTARGAPLMVWQDGQNCFGVRDLINFRLQTVPTT